MVANSLIDIEVGTPEYDAIINAIPGSAIWIMKLSMMILPLICILVGFVLYRKKFIIDEELYAKIVDDLNAKNAGVAPSEAPADAPSVDVNTITIE
jgi:Na+/melibiose symporter-like transporter